MQIATPSALRAWTISEHGSPAQSPAASWRSPASTPMNRYPSLSQSAGVPSPAPSLSSVFMPKISSFTGQSPAPSYSSITVPQALSGQQWSAEVQATAPIKHRYQEADERHL